MLTQRDRANEVSKLREGTRCRICGEPITSWDKLSNNVISTEGGCLGGIIYGHKDCCEMRSYHYEHLVRNKKATYSGVQFGVELESNQNTTYEQRLFLYACYGLVCTSDCTVAEEFKSGINQGLHGIKKYFEGIEKVVDIASGDNCGSHVNISLAKWENTDEIRRRASILFGSMAATMAELPRETMERVFGRTFGEFRRYTEDCFEHGFWLQIKDKCLEFRISRYKNSTQYSHLIMMYAEMVKAIDSIYLSNPSDYTARKASKRIIVILKAHIEGSAKYQKEERNK